MRNSSIRNIKDLPKCIIFIAPFGSGKKFEANLLGYSLINSRAEDLNKLLDSVSDGKFALTNFDYATDSVKQIILKVLEDNNDLKFCILVENLDNVPNTIKNRSQVYFLDTITKKELEEYCDDKYLTSSEKELCPLLADTFGEVDLLLNYGIKQFNEFLDKFIDALPRINLGNIFKTRSYFNLTNKESSKYDIRLFFKSLCNKLIIRSLQKDLFAIRTINIYLNKYSQIDNKLALLDTLFTELHDIYVKR